MRHEPAPAGGPLARLSGADRAQVLRDAWWAHDGQWFLKAKARYGLQAALELNEAAIESQGRIEMRHLHAALGRPRVASAADLLPLVLAVHELLDLPAEGETAGEDAFVLREIRCRAWEMTVAAGLEEVAPGCRGSMRRRLGWATFFFPRERVEWTRLQGPPEGPAPCAYRFRLLPG
jgi:hypothetical protein